MSTQCWHHRINAWWVPYNEVFATRRSPVFRHNFDILEAETNDQTTAERKKMKKQKMRKAPQYQIYCSCALWDSRWLHYMIQIETVCLDKYGSNIRGLFRTGWKCNALPTAAHTLRRRLIIWATWLCISFSSVPDRQSHEFLNTFRKALNNNAIRPQREASQGINVSYATKEIDINLTYLQILQESFQNMSKRECEMKVDLTFARHLRVVR